MWEKKHLDLCPFLQKKKKKNPPYLTKGLFLYRPTNRTIHTGLIMWSIAETWPVANLISAHSNVPQETNVND